MSHKYSFDRFKKFTKENEGINEICRARLAAVLSCEGCKFETACKEFFEKKFPDGSLHDR